MAASKLLGRRGVGGDDNGEVNALVQVGVPSAPDDKIGSRLGIAVTVSVLINICLWCFVAQIVKHRIAVQLPPATFKRIILPPPKPPKKTIPPKPKALPPKPQPVVKPVLTPHPIVQRQPQQHTPAPQPQHNRVLTSTGPSTSAGTAESGGTAPVGQPVAIQGSGNSVAPPPPAPVPAQPQPAPPVPVPSPTPAPAPKPAPPAGPTQDAQATSQVLPQIPSDLETDDYKSFVRVKVDIQAEGSFSVTLLTSSGNTDVDIAVLQALKQWRWKPALDAGVPVESEQRFRFNFTIQ